jgi:hypothetical protein
MISWRDFRAALTTILATSLVCPPMHALVTLNDGHDHIFVNGSVGMTYDSNIFAKNGGSGDYAFTTGYSAEYTRRAGWIGVNANVAITGSHYAKIKGIDYANPTFGLELTKQSGRTTGSLTVNAARESRADAALNLRSTSWNYTPGLNFKYPFSGAYTLSGTLGYAARKYVDETALTNLATYSASFDLYRVLTSDRDATLGYRYRYDESSAKSAYTDHALNFGISGKLIRGLKGALRAGYQTHVGSGSAAHEPHYGSWTMSGSATHPVNKKLSFTASLSKDVSITGTDASVDTTAVTLDGQYAFSSHLAITAELGGGDSRFVGERGREVISAGPPIVLGPQRRDDYLNSSLSITYTLNEHLSAAISYAWFRNWSTSPFADFVRKSWSLTLSSRW